MELISFANPDFIPGYAGCCPQYKYRMGSRYGTTTHKVLLDPKNLVLTDRTADDYTVIRPDLRDIDIVNESLGHNIYKHPMVPGYEGFVPGEHAEFGHSYSVQATEALSDFEIHQNQSEAAMDKIKKVGYPQDIKLDPKTLEDKQLTKSDLLLPVYEVRPKQAGLLRNIPVTAAPLTPNYAASPYFPDDSDPENLLKADVYWSKKNQKFLPVGICRPDPLVLIHPTEIYHTDIGMLPHYGGYIPGAMFRSGHTYGDDSRDAKRRLRGDLSN